PRLESRCSKFPRVGDVHLGSPGFICDRSTNAQGEPVAASRQRRALRLALAARGAAPLERGEPMKANRIGLGVIVASIFWNAPTEAAGTAIPLTLNYSATPLSHPRHLT